MKHKITPLQQAAKSAMFFLIYTSNRNHLRTVDNYIAELEDDIEHLCWFIDVLDFYHNVPWWNPFHITEDGFCELEDIYECAKKMLTGHFEISI